MALSCFPVASWIFCMVGVATRAAVLAEPPAAISGCGGFLFWLCRGWYTPEQVSCTPDPTGLRFTIPADASFLCQ